MLVFELVVSTSSLMSRESTLLFLCSFNFPRSAYDGYQTPHSLGADCLSHRGLIVDQTVIGIVPASVHPTGLSAPIRGLNASAITNDRFIGGLFHTSPD